jgi:hypothetical protein
MHSPISLDCVFVYDMINQRQEKKKKANAWREKIKEELVF